MKSTKKIDTAIQSRKIEIPEDILEVYQQSQQRGDYSRISELCYGSTDHRQKVMMALLSGKGEQKLVEIIIQFYTEVSKRNEEILSEYDSND
jgi:hypothetical protein